MYAERAHVVPCPEEDANYIGVVNAVDQCSIIAGRLFLRIERRGAILGVGPVECIRGTSLSYL